MKLESMALANAFALTTAIVWTVCYLFLWFLQDFSATVSQWWMHGRDVSVLGSMDLNWQTFLYGGLSLTLVFWLIGYVFGWAWDWVSGK